LALRVLSSLAVAVAAWGLFVLIEKLTFGTVELPALLASVLAGAVWFVAVWAEIKIWRLHAEPLRPGGSAND
jgi:hypothetical protein